MYSTKLLVFSLIIFTSLIQVQFSSQKLLCLLLNSINFCLIYIMYSFVELSLSIQQRLAVSIGGKLYVYDSSGVFDNAITVVKDNIRYLQIGDKRAVLSGTAQKLFTKFTYTLFSVNRLYSDEYGLYIIV